MNIADAVAIVTGASSGLGRVCAELLLENGSTVFGLARRRERLDELEGRLGPGFQGITCDVRVESEIEDAVGEVLREAGRIDILINNAGLGRFGAVDKLAVEDWDVQMETNLRGLFLCTRAVLPTMKRQNEKTGFGGHVVNIASVAGLIGNPNIGAYNATKFGVRGFSESLMKEVRQDGIKVTCVYPGSFETEFSEVAQSSASPNPMHVRDVASTVLYVLDTPDNYLISEVVMRPLRPRG